MPPIYAANKAIQLYTKTYLSISKRKNIAFIRNIHTLSPWSFFASQQGNSAKDKGFANDFHEFSE